MRARNEIVSYLILVGGILVSFSIFVYALFGKEVVDLYKPGGSFLYCLLILFMDIKQYYKIQHINEAYATLFFVPFTFMMIIVLAPMFTAIIVDAFREESNELEAYYEIKKESKKFKLHWVYRGSELWKD